MISSMLLSFSDGGWEATMLYCWWWWTHFEWSPLKSSSGSPAKILLCVLFYQDLWSDLEHGITCRTKNKLCYKHSIFIQCKDSVNVNIGAVRENCFRHILLSSVIFVVYLSIVIHTEVSLQVILHSLYKYSYSV